MRRIFRVCSRYQDGTVPKDELTTACCNIMTTVSQPSRLGSWYREVSRRMAAGDSESALDTSFWKSVHDWTQLSTMVLEQRLLNRLTSHYVLPDWCRKHNMEVMRDAIGEKGELLLIKIDTENFGISEEELEAIEAGAIRKTCGPADRLDPGFD